MSTCPSVQRLDSGYWLVRWDRENWAQFRGTYPRYEDFFHPEWSYSEARVNEAARVIASVEQR